MGGNNNSSPNTTAAQINNLRGNTVVLASRETPGQSGRWLLDKQRWLLMFLRNAKSAAAAWFCHDCGRFEIIFMIMKIINV